jgi:tRNA U34 5-carboxymethylaminomethyl modifying GTPase MnmE/TrmE
MLRSRAKKYGSVIHNGISAMILAEPNAGKSSVFHFLLGEDCPIVSEITETTRDIISERMMIESKVLQIYDLARLRDGALGEIEKNRNRKSDHKCLKCWLLSSCREH